MLNSDELDYLNKISPTKMVDIKPFKDEIKQIVNEITKRIKKVTPKLTILHMGASALQISGQNDIDLYILASKVKFNSHLSKLIKEFGNPKNRKIDSIAWKFNMKGYEVEMYLTDPNSKPMQRQIKVFEILKGNKTYLKEYEKLKEKMNGKSFREYQEKKYIFYHKILDK